MSDLLRIGQKFSLPVLPGSGDALAIIQQARALKKPLLVITENAQTAARLQEELPWFAPELRVSILPDWETLPYETFSPHQDLISERLSTLWQIRNEQCDIILVPCTTALYFLAPLEFLTAYTFFLQRGQRLNVEKLKADLVFAGYTAVTQVMSPGEFAMRGGLLDLFPMGSVLPYRIDLFDEDIDTIRTFDVDTQKSLYPVNEIRLLPAREFPLDDSGRSAFRQRFRERFEGDPSKARLYKDISKGSVPGGIEYYLPLFFENTATLFDYLPAETVIVTHGQLEKSTDEFWRDCQSRYRSLNTSREHPLLRPDELFLSVDQFFGHLKNFARLEITAQEGVEQLPDLTVERRAENPIFRLQQYLQNHTQRVLLLAESLGRRETMLAFLSEHGLIPALCNDWLDFETQNTAFALGVGPLANGFVGDGLTVITESELYAHVARSRVSKQKKRATNVDMLVRDLAELKVGDPVVHEQHGVGRYQGLVMLDMGSGDTEFLLLEYAGEDKLYVPVSGLALISRYSGATPEAAPLHKLGSGHWDKAKKKALEQARDTAAELLNLYAQRAAREGYAFTLDEHDYLAFCEGFGFEETADQAAAIGAVLKDMTSGKPMDRLVCGDVGFGKTEVALRAAFVALMNGKQVAVLAPTTLLTEQHYQSFCDRFSDWPIKIAELSRFRSSKEQAATLAGIADGSVDLVIGTHRLVQPDMVFKNLGLVIIDEEHRFGVRQKEQMKAIRAEVDVLTLTATPIPRTLAMSLEGIRDFSVIATAPHRRLSIKTFVSRWSESVIREAVLREFKRGGQVFFLYNEVETILNMQARLAELLPEARIAIAHGQMPERELEAVMRDFNQQRFNILLCTTIIETGIDIPNANTIIMHRADKFGLAQLHQLRGRVGRSHHQAYAYLLTQEEGTLTPQAQKRLEAIQQLQDLGSGFYLAMHDLEIRGAGEVLGEGQSGEMQEIGFTLYNDMLKRAVKALKKAGGATGEDPLDVLAEINLHSPALLPNDYCPDVHERLVIYKRLASAESDEQLDEIHQEIVDRFGLLPRAAENLLAVHRLRLIAKPLGIQKLDATETAIIIQFIPQPPIDPIVIMKLIQSKRNYKLAGPDKLRIETALPDSGIRIARVREVFKELGAKV